MFKIQMPEVFTLAIGHHQAGRLKEAEAAFAIRPNYPEADYKLRNALRDAGRQTEAAAAYRLATGLNPKYGAALNNLGGVLIEQGAFDQERVVFRRALDLAMGRGIPSLWS